MPPFAPAPPRPSPYYLRGGLPPPRPDQSYQPPTPGVPGGSRNIFKGKLVIIFGGGPSSGLFIYSGTPALGNSPVLSAVAPGVTADPYGNPTKAVLNIGTFAAAHVGWDANGNQYVSDTNGITRVLVTGGAGGVWAGAPDPAIVFYNSFGAVVLVVDPQRGGTFQYLDNNSAVQGGLIGAQVGKNTTDPILGNVVSAGVNVINPVFGDTTRVVGSQILIDQLNWNNPAQISPTGGTPAGAVGPALNFFGPFQTGVNNSEMALFGESPDATILGGLVLGRFSAQTQLVKATSGLIELQGGTHAIQNTAPPAFVAGYNQQFSNGGHYGTVATDQITYDTEQLTLALVNDTASLTNTVDAVITDGTVSLQKTVQAQQYRVTAVIAVKQGAAAGSVTVACHGPAVGSGGQGGAAVDNANVNNVSWTTHGTGTATIAMTNIGRTTIFRLDGVLTFTIPGLLSIQSHTSAAADPYSIQAGSFFEIQPVNAT